MINKLIEKDYQENKEEWNKMLKESSKEKQKKLKGLVGHAYYAKIHDMQNKGEW